MDTSKLVVKESMLTAVPTPVRLLLVRALAEVLEKGWTDNGGWFLLEHGHRAVWLEYDGAPVAVTTVEAVESHHMLWMPLVYVVPEHRRQGLFRLLLTQIRFGAKAKGLKAVQLGTHHTNEGMRGAATAAGMQPSFLRFTIPALTDEEVQALTSKNAGGTR